MRNAKRVCKKLLASFLCMAMAAGMLAGVCTYKNSKEVKAATTGFTSNDFLKCDGTSIKNNYGKGNMVYLRGTNTGGWLVQESWMCSTNVRDQKTLMSNMESRFGTDTMYELLDHYENNYWTESDFDNCKEMGMSAIRVPFTYMNLYRYDSSKADWVLRSDAFTKLDWFVEECSERGIYVILDLHGAFGSQNGQDHSGEVIDNVSDVTFFSNDYYKNKTLELWKTVAAHYEGNPAIAAYDTLNEPGEKAGTTNAKHWAFYDQMYQAIRSVDKDHIIIMESCWGTSNLPNPSDYGWTNVMYEYHHYTWDYISDLDGQKRSCDSLINSVNNANYGVPTFIGEYTCFGLEDAWNYVMDKFNNAGWHYTSWAYKTNNSGSWGIYQEKTTDKVNPASDSVSSIQTKWGANSIGTGSKSTNGMVYSTMKNAMPGTVVFADKALTDADYFSMKATINNKYVCADNYGESNLIANRDSAGAWEQFRVIYNADGTVSFQSRANNKYLCAVFDDTDTENPVIPRSNAIGTWEKFYVEQQSDGTYALRTYVNDYYVQADINDANQGILHACATAVGTWEKFTLEASNQAAIPGSNTGAEETTQPEVTTGEPETTQSEMITGEPETTQSQAAEGNLISKRKTVVVSGSENDSFAGQYAVDGDKGTRWSSDFADDAWIYVDLEKAYAIDQVVLTWENAYGKDYDIQVSADGTNWTTVRSMRDQTGGETTISMNNIAARYVKMQGVTRALQYGYSLWEMEVYGTELKEEETTPTPTSENVVTCPGSFAIDAIADKSSEIEFNTNEGTKFAGQLVNGSYLTYKVNVKTVGKYELSLDLATTSSGRQIQIEVDGNNAAAMSPAAASSWFTFTTYKSAITFAGPGIHTLTIKASGSCNIANPEFVEYEEEVNVEVPSSSGKYGNNFKAVAYYPNWYGDITSDIQWDKLTNIIYAFALPNASGVLDSVDGSANVINSLISAAHANDTKVELAVGGWSYSDGSMCQYVFEQATNTDAKCRSLANSILEVVDKYGFDGVDIDWEYPTASSASQYTTFMRYLREGLTQRGLTLSSAVAATGGTYQTDEVLQMVDWINVMAYDGNSGSGHSPYSLLTDSFYYWNTTRNMDASKIVLGVPFYERPNWASYADIVAANPANAYNDSAVINGTTVYYNGLNTMANKATFAAQNAGGIMIWEISQDSKDADYSLLNQIYRSATAVVGTGSQATVTQIPGTVAVNSYGEKTGSITMNTEGTVTYAGNLNNESYLDYYIKVPEKGSYTLNLQLAAGDTQYNAENIIVKINDTNAATVAINPSSSWTTFISHQTTLTFAAKGTYKLTLAADGGACNIADFTFSKVETATQPEETTTSEETTTPEEIITPEETTAPEETTTPEQTTMPETITPEETTQPETDAEYSAWDENTIYVNGDRVYYNGKVYQAKWWTVGENPETCGQWGVWKEV